MEGQYGIGPHGERMNVLSRRVTSQQMMERIRNRQDNYLNSLIEKFKRQMHNFDGSKIYPDEVLNVKLQGIDRLLSHNGRLAPVLSSLQLQNNSLRNEMSLLSSELSKSLSICESLIAENMEQKNIILNKNNDIKRIIESIALNETQARGQLEHKNNLLQQENSILIKHMEELKREKEDRSNEWYRIQDQAELWKNENAKSQSDLKEALQREQELARKLALFEQNYFVQGDQLSTLKDQYEMLKIQANQYKNQAETLREQLNQTKRDSVRDKYQEQITKLILDYEDLKVQRQQLVRDCQKKRIQCQQLLAQNRDFEQQLDKLSASVQLTSGMLMQQKNRNAQLQAVVNKLEARVSQLRSQNEALRFEAERTQTVFTQKQKILQGEIQQLRQQIDERAAIVEKRILEIRNRSDQALQAKQQEVSDLMQANNSLKRIIEKGRPI